MILLVGNFLSKHGLNPTAIEDLAMSLSEKYTVVTASDKLNSFYRLMDMISKTVKHRKLCQLIIVDVFSTYALIFSCLVILLAKLLNIPYIPVFRGGYLFERYRKYPRIFIYLFFNARTIVCPSKYLKNCFDNKSDRIKVIPNYIDLKNYNFRIRKDIKPKILWVRSIHSIYNPEMAIHTLEKIKKTYSDAKLCMVGPVKDERVMEKMNKLIIRLNLQNNVSFSGQLSKTEWASISKNFDIFINTTDYDNNPVSLLEAMALWLPIVSTNVGGVPYLIDDNVTGLLVEPKKAEQMAEKINEIVSGNVDGYQIAKTAREQVSNYAKNEIIKQWFQTIDECI